MTSDRGERWRTYDKLPDDATLAERALNRVWSNRRFDNELFLALVEADRAIRADERQRLAPSTEAFERIWRDYDTKVLEVQPTSWQRAFIEHFIRKDERQRLGYDELVKSNQMWFNEAKSQAAEAEQNKKLRAALEQIAAPPPSRLYSDTERIDILEYYSQRITTLRTIAQEALHD
jgi:hypothetical protein